MKQNIIDLKSDSGLQRRWSFHPYAITLLFMGIFILFFSPMLFSNSLFIFDGLIPGFFKMNFWSNSIFSGYPLITDPIWAAFYPLKFILFYDFNFYVISGYLLMALLTYAYAYYITEIKIAAFISAILFSFSGYAIFEIGHAAHFIQTICWLPLILLSLEKLKGPISYFWIAVGVLATTMTVFAGFPQLTFAILPILLSYALLLSFNANNKFKKALFYLGILTAGYLIASPQIIPTFILSLVSARKNITWEFFASYYVEVKQLLLFNFPYLMGGYHGFYTQNPIIGNWDIVGNHGFVGFFSLILAGLGLIKSRSHLKAVSYYWLVFCLLSLLFALGPELSMFYKILFHVPIINNFRAPMRYLFIFSFGISILAGIGIKVMLQGTINTARQKRIIFIVSLIFAIILLGFVIGVYPSLQATALEKFKSQLPPLFANPAVFIPFFWIICSLLGLLNWLGQPTSWNRCFIAVMILVGELLSTAYFSYVHPVPSFWTKEELYNPPAFLTELRNDLNVSNQRYLLLNQSSEPVDKYLWGNFPMYYSLPSATGYTNLVPQRYLEFLQISDAGYSAYNLFPDKFALNQAINLAGIKYLITGSTPLNDLWFKDKNRFKLRQTIGNMNVYENLAALPRVRFVSKLFTMSAPEILYTIYMSKFIDGKLFDPKEVALIEADEYLNFEKDNTAKARIEKLEDNQIIIHTQSEKSQFLVLSDTYFSGWKAYIDKKRTKIFKTNYVFRGIVVPAGSHQVVFEFRPSYLYLGFLVSLLTVLVLGFAFLRHFLKNNVFTLK